MATTYQYLAPTPVADDRMMSAYGAGSGGKNGGYIGGGAAGGGTMGINFPNVGGTPQWAPSVGAPNYNLQPGSNSGGWQATLPGQPGSPFPTAGAPAWMGTDQNWWQNDKNQGAVNSWMNANVPLWQLQQNQTQYAKDFNEAQRQYNQNYNLQAQGQAWNQDFQTQQFNTQTGQWERTFDANNRQNEFNNQLARDQFGQTQLRDKNAQNNWQQEFGQTQWRDQQQQSNWNQEFGANRSDTAWNQNFQQNQANTQNQQWNQQFGLNQQGQQFNQQHQTAQLAQQAQLAEQQNKTQLESAAYSAFGRNRKPATGWASYG